MSPRVILCGKVNRKGSHSESESEMGVKSHGVDPKLGELPMGRLKPL